MQSVRSQGPEVDPEKYIVLMGLARFLRTFLNNNLRYKRCSHDWLWTRWLNPWSYARPRGSPGNRSCKKRCLNLESLILRQIWSYQVQGSRQKVRKYFIATVRAGKYWQSILQERNEPLSHALHYPPSHLLDNWAIFCQLLKSPLLFIGWQFVSRVSHFMMNMVPLLLTIIAIRFSSIMNNGQKSRFDTAA